MNSELLALSMLLSAVSQWINTNRQKIDALPAEEFKKLADRLSAERHDFLDSIVNT